MAVRHVRISAYSALVLMSLLSVVPLIWVWFSSLRSSQEIADDPLGLPWPPDWSSYARAWTDARFSDYLMNSVLVAVGIVVLVT